MTDTLKQNYIDEKTDELAYFVEETGRVLSQYHDGSATEEDLLRTTGKAVERYEELNDRVDEVTQQLRDRDVFEEFREDVRDAGYNDVEDFMLGRNPVTTSNSNPEREVIDSLTSQDYIETDAAFDVMSDYTDLVLTLDEHYGVEAPLPELNEKGEEIMAKIGEIEEMMEDKGISSDEAIDQVDIF